MPSRSSSNSRSCGSAAGICSRTSREQLRLPDQPLPCPHAAAGPRHRMGCHGHATRRTSRTRRPRNLPPSPPSPGPPGSCRCRGVPHVHDTAAAADRALHHRLEGRHLPAPTDQARPLAPGQAIPRADRQSRRARTGSSAPLMCTTPVPPGHAVLDQPRGRLRQHHPAGGSQPIPSAARSHRARPRR